jgi:hypothetical protein
VRTPMVTDGVARERAGPALMQEVLVYGSILSIFPRSLIFEL